MNRPLQLLKFCFIDAFKFVFNLFYKVLTTLRKTDQKKFVIAYFREDYLEGNLKFVRDEIINQMPSAKIHLVKSNNKMNFKLFKELITISNARYIILDDYFLPVYLIKPKENLKIIQLWHAAGAFKKFGYSTVGTKFGPDKEYLKHVPIHSNYTHVYVSTKRVIDYYSEAFNTPGNHIYPVGIPRIDLFQSVDLCSEIKNEILNQYPILNDRAKVLIAPTYRADNSQGETDFDIIETIIKHHQEIKSEVLIIFNPHPYTPSIQMNRLMELSNVVLANNYSINEWMLVADAFITDYSSSVFEFGLLNKPIAHFVPDYLEYKRNRGLYEDVHEVSDGAILKFNEELINWVNSRQMNETYDCSRMNGLNFDYTKGISNRIVRNFISEK